MNTTVESLEGNQVKLTMTVSADDVDRYLKATYRTIANKNQFPGFRKGHAPAKVIDAMVGRDYVLATATQDLVNELFPQAMDAEDLRPIKDADFGDATDAMIEPGKEFSITATVTDTPKLELDSYDPVKIDLLDDKASDKEVDEQIDAMREYYFSLKEVEREAAKGDLATVDITTTFGDIEVPAYTATDRTFEVGRFAFPEEIDSQIQGMTPGESKSFDFAAPANSLAAVNAKEGDTFHADVTLTQLQEKVFPEVGDELAKTAGFDDLAQMREQVAASIERQKAQIIPRMKEDECGHELEKRLIGDVPAEMVASTQQQLLRDFFVGLQRQGLTFDTYLRNNGMTSEQFQNDVRQQAMDVTRESLALDALARHLNVEVTDEDIDKEFEDSGVDDPKATRKDWERRGQMAFIREGIRRAKASDWLLENAEVTKLSAEELAEKRKAESADEAADDDAKAADEKPADEKPAADAKADAPEAEAK